MAERAPAGAGPVLSRGPYTEAVLQALRAENPGLTTIDRGAYVRVGAARSCRLVRARVEEITQRPFRLPSDLEAIMPAFHGRLRLTEDEAVWELGPDEGKSP